jgi:hypothetical protein
MSIFGTILQKLGIEKTAGANVTPPPKANASVAGTEAPMVSAPNDASPTQPASKAVSQVDVVGKLDKLAGENSGLDWKASIVDLLKLLKMDSGLEARKELATELGCPADLMGGDYSKMNVWLHKTVLQKIAQNGGNIPQNFLK